MKIYPASVLSYKFHLVLLKDLHPEFYRQLGICLMSVLFSVLVTLVIKLPDFSAPDKSPGKKKISFILMLGSLIILQQMAVWANSLSEDKHLLLEAMTIGGCFFFFQLSMSFSNALLHEKNENSVWLMPLVWGQDLQVERSKDSYDHWDRVIDGFCLKLKSLPAGRLLSDATYYLLLSVIIMFVGFRVSLLRIAYLFSWIIMVFLGAVNFLDQASHFLWFNLVSERKPPVLAELAIWLLLIGFYWLFWRWMNAAPIAATFSNNRDPLFRKKIKRYALCSFLIAYYFFMLQLAPLASHMMQSIPLTSWLHPLDTHAFGLLFKNLSYGAILFGNAFLAFHVILFEIKPKCQ